MQRELSDRMGLTDYYRDDLTDWVQDIMKMFATEVFNRAKPIVVDVFSSTKPILVHFK